VLALVVLTPVLASDLIGAQNKATDRGVETVLQADVPIATKVPLAADLSRTLQDTGAQVPNFKPVFARHENSGNRQQLERVRDELVGVIDAMVTRSTRRAFAISSLLALLALAPLPLLHRRQA
jgi:hypothetical protein